jgi:hypothetical protein
MEFEDWVVDEVTDVIYDTLEDRGLIGSSMSNVLSTDFHERLRALEICLSIDLEIADKFKNLGKGVHQLKCLSFAMQHYRKILETRMIIMMSKHCDGKINL